MDLNLYTILQNVLNESVGQNEVVDAIQKKQVIMMTYDDEQDNPHVGKRWTEPYALVSLPSGNLGIRAFQYNGDTRRGVPKWKLFRLDRIQSWTPTNSKFTVSRDGYNRLGDKQYPVITQVQFSNDDVWVTRNLQDTAQQNKNTNVDAFGRKIDKKIKTQKQGPVPTTAVTQTMTQQVQPSGPVQPSQTDIAKDRKSAWKKFNDLKYQKNKRDMKKADKLRQQEFGDDEAEVMNNFDKEKLF